MRNQNIMDIGGFPNAPMVVKKRGRRYLSVPVAGGGVRILLPIVREDAKYYTVYNPLVGRGLVPLLKVPKDRSADFQLSLLLSAFQK